MSRYETQHSELAVAFSDGERIVWLGRESDWLLIFDNADRPELIQPFLPREITGHILVTSRSQDFQDLGIVQPLAMEMLVPEEAIVFLLRRTGKLPPSVPNKEDIPNPHHSVGARASRPYHPKNPAHNGEQDTTKTDPEYTAATELAAELAYLPLALEQAAAYIVTNRVPFATYLKSYRKQRLKRLEKAKPKLGHYPDSIATTWASSSSSR